jgi:putative transposase
MDLVYIIMKRIHRYTENAVYHCLSRTVHGEKWLDNHGKAVFCKSLQKVAGFCGVRILTYCVMANHFHLLIEVPARHLRESLSDAELVRRFRLLYGEKGSVYMPISTDKLETVLAAGGAEARRWRETLRERMNDLPMFMKLLKQRFSQWYNATHHTYGTFWASRYTSLLVDPDAEILRKIACYIDLNPVRAGLAEDPASYPWSGYGAAAAGSSRMRESLAYLSTDSGGLTLNEAYNSYEQELYQRGAFPLDQPGKRGIIPSAIAQRVIGATKQPAIIEPFTKTFSDWIQRGYVMGRKDFIEKNYQWAAALMGRKREVRITSGERATMHCLNGSLT